MDWPGTTFPVLRADEKLDGVEGQDYGSPLSEVDETIWKNCKL